MAKKLLTDEQLKMLRTESNTDELLAIRNRVRGYFDDALGGGLMFEDALVFVFSKGMEAVEAKKRKRSKKSGAQRQASANTNGPRADA